MPLPDEFSIFWTDYLKYRVKTRGYRLEVIEGILKTSTERYFDTETYRRIAVGRHEDRIVMIPYEREGSKLTPVTIHAITRQQINFRIKTGRLTNE